MGEGKYDSRWTELLSNSNFESFTSAFVTPAVGASGAIYGLLMAFGFLFPNQVIYVYFLFPLKAKYLVVILGAAELFMGLQNNPADNVAHFAHLGGMIFGFILLKLWKVQRIM